MAQRRMFSLQIVDTDAFLEMPSSTQLLYFHLSMRADDDGFVSNPKKIMRIINASEDDLKILFSKRFIIGFQSGVIVIKHWRMHNYIRNDRYTETVYQNEKATLLIKDNGSYTEKLNKNVPDTNCQPNGNQLDTQVRLGKDSIGKDKKEENIIPPSLDMVKAFCDTRNNSIDPEAFISFYNSKGWMIGKNKMKDWHSAIYTWEKRNKSNVSERSLDERLKDAGVNA